MEEPDLDAFLRRHDASSGDDEHQNHGVHHRTVDDILNDSDSSSPSSSPPSTIVSLSSFKNNDSFSARKALNSSDKPSSSAQLKYNLIQRLKSDDFSGKKTTSSLFGGGVRSAAKPGAALAAAAAASRPIPTRHAAVIKSRRALSVSMEGKVSDGDILGFTRDDLSDRISVTGQADVKSMDGDGGDEIQERESDSVESSERNGGKGANELQTDNGSERVMSNEESSMLDSNVETQRSMSCVEEVDLSVKEKTLSVSDDVEKTDSEHSADKEVGSFLRIRIGKGANELQTDYGSERVLSNEEPSMLDSNVETQRAMSCADEGDLKVGFSLELENKKSAEQDSGHEAQQSQDMENTESILESESGVYKDDSTSIDDDIAELVEDRITELESESASRKAEEKVLSMKKPLELAEELEKKLASSGMDWAEGAAAQPMRLEGVRRGSTVLGYFDTDADNIITRTIKSQAFRRDYGMPQVLAAHLNYLALGMSKGLIIAVPSKYSAQHPDNMDVKMLMLGAQGDRSQVPVTSICFNQQGDLLLAGYGDGHITVWNIPRGTVAKVITGEHTAPVVHSLFLGQDSQVTRQFKAVTGDCKGLVMLHEFSMMPLLGFTIKSQCLLDGQRTGTVLCASPLLPDEFSGGAPVTPQANTTGSASSIGGVMGGVVGGASGWKLFGEGSPLPEEGVVIFVTHQTALVVKLSPSLQVYASLPKPEGVREGSMPYTAWKCTIQARGSTTENVNPEAVEKISLLAIAWDRKVQVAKLVKSELKVSGKWTLESAAVGLAWLDDQMLVILTLAGQLCLFTREGSLIHQTSYAIDGFGGDDLIAYHTYFTNAFGNPEKAYHNSVAVRGASAYILGPMHVVVSRLLPWRERIQVLRRAGDWMGALNMAMTLYDGQAHGVVDLPRNLHAVQESIMPHLVELLLSYVDEVFSYISVACFNRIEKVEELDGSENSSSAYSEIKEQFIRVGGVAVEFCVHIKRTDILFDDIFSKFVAVQHRDTFLELLEPYILKDMLGSLPPEIMQALVEHYNNKGWLQRVEQCVLHMDISSLDFNQVVRLCRENGLYGALIYLFNKGLDDFKTPLEELLTVLRSKEKYDTAASVGYRMLVYLKYCFSGLAFPPGHGTLPSERLPSLRMELVQFLLEDSGGPKSQRATSLISTGAYMNLHYLLELDTEATLDILSIAFGEDGNFKPESSLCLSLDPTDDNAKDNDSITGNHDIIVQKTVDALVLILDVDISQTIRSTGSDDTEFGVWPSTKDIGHLIEFIANYIASKRANVSKSVLSQILEYLTSEDCLLPNGLEQKNESKKRRENKVLALLEAVSQTEWNASYVLHLCEKVQFYQVCGLIHSIRHQYVAALDSYMKDVDAPVHAFSFINSILQQLSETETVAFRSAVISRIPELVILNRECTFHLIFDHFNKENGNILSELQSNEKSLFLYLKTLVEVHLSGTLNFSCTRTDDVVDGRCGGRVKHGQNWLEAYLERISEFPKILRNRPVEVTDDMIELYLELLCQYEPDSVLKFLDTFENYRVDRCLQLCQEYGIVDAAAFLLERVGDVGSALVLTLSGINDKFIMLDNAVGVSDMAGVKHAYADYFAAASGFIEGHNIRKILRACIGLCQRNTPRLDPEESESLWFHLLDSFCKPLTISEGNSEIDILTQSLSSKDDQEVDSVKWRVPKNQKYAPILKRLFSQFVKEIVEGMIGYVRLPSIMAKLLSDNSSQEFGDFKLTIMGMLGTYGFERRILDTAKSLIEDDTFYNMSVLKKGASKGYAPQTLLCCICNCFFTKNSSSSGIRVFNCGHAAHLQCEIQENDTSNNSSSSGCPICVHKKKIQKTKGKMVEQGLVSTTPSRSKRAQGATILHPHELDAFENSSGSHQISRFEILNSLQKNQRLIQADTMPQLRLAPPAVYHEKINKRSHLSAGTSSGGLMDSEKLSKNRQLRNLRVKGSSIRFPLKSKIFGKEKTRVQ